jgi:hypothetical protein
MRGGFRYTKRVERPAMGSRGRGGLGLMPRLGANAISDVAETASSGTAISTAMSVTALNQFDQTLTRGFQFSEAIDYNKISSLLDRGPDQFRNACQLSAVESASRCR